MMGSIKAMIRTLLYRLRGDHTTEQLIRQGLRVGKNFNRLIGVILDPAHCWLISIGDDVTMAPNVHILAHDASTCHDLGYARIGRVDIGSNVFIGAGSVVLPNVTIGDNVVIGAGSVVTHSIPSNTVAAGNPARKIMDYDAYIARERKRMEERPVWDERWTLRNPNITPEQKRYEEETGRWNRFCGVKEAGHDYGFYTCLQPKRTAAPAV